VTVLHFDWETKSRCDLKECGLANYAVDPTTDILCGGWAFDDEEPQVWVPPAPCPPRIRQHVESGGIVFGHNVNFEIQIWNAIAVKRYGWPKISVKQTRCTMAMAYAQALPGSLERAAAAVGVQEQKDLAGGRLMIQMSKPRAIKSDGAVVWWEDEQKTKTLHEYNKQDVRVERALEKRLMPLSAAEQALWQLDAAINDRGIYIDQRAVAKAIELVQAEQDRLNKEMRRVTGNFVGFCTEVKRLTDWVRLQGVPVDGLAKADVLDALADMNLPSHVREALLLRQEAGKSSTAKLNAMLQRVSADGRIRGTLQYHGAAPGRWTGRGIQVHNFPRGKLSPKEVDEVLTLLSQGAFA